MLYSVSKRLFSSQSSTVTNSLKLILTTPHQTPINGITVHQVNLVTSSGAMGILANHVPIIQQLQPGTIEVIQSNDGSNTSRFFASGGFAVIGPDSTLTISASEAWPLSAFLPESITRLREQTQNHMSQTTNEKERLAATISLQVLDVLAEALSPTK